MLAAGVLAGCGGGDGGGTPAAPSSAAEGLGEVTTDAEGVQEVTIQTQDDYVFTPDTFTVQPGPVRLTVVNVAEQLTHNFRFTPGETPEPVDEEIPLLAPGQSETIEFEVTAPGDYGFDCSFHIQLGQVGTMTVAAG
ncbi:plastocyanin/azurin family copper-binding protein [Geodermatophilus sp. SYSU D00691]